VSPRECADVRIFARDLPVYQEYGSLRGIFQCTTKSRRVFQCPIWILECTHPSVDSLNCRNAEPAVTLNGEVKRLSGSPRPTHYMCGWTPPEPLPCNRPGVQAKWGNPSCRRSRPRFRSTFDGLAPRRERLATPDLRRPATIHEVLSWSWLPLIALRNCSITQLSVGPSQRCVHGALALCRVEGRCVALVASACCLLVN